MDIIDTLTQYYGVSAPVFVDNREAVTLATIQSQVISLIVSEADKTLRGRDRNMSEQTTQRNRKMSYGS